MPEVDGRRTDAQLLIDIAQSAAQEDEAGRALLGSLQYMAEHGMRDTLHDCFDVMQGERGTEK